MFKTVSQDLNAEMLLFEEYLLRLFSNRDLLSQQAAHKLMNIGGKRLRPMFTMLFARGAGHSPQERRFAAAAAVEIVHTATLVHDDIIDEATTRRGQETIHSRYGVHMAVYLGDYLLMKGAQQFLTTNDDQGESIEFIKKLTDVLEGEIQQYFSAGKLVTVCEYLKKTSKKTASLFGMACSLGALCAGFSERDRLAARQFGNYFGMAFQIRDDILNLLPESTEDKDALIDLKNGTITLPVIYALQDACAEGPLTNDALAQMMEDGSLLELCRARGIEPATALMNRYFDKADAILQRLGYEEIDRVYGDLREKMAHF